MGRPSKIDSVCAHDENGKPITVREQVLRALHAGAYVEDAAKSAGIHPSTFYEWLARGEEHRKALAEDDGYAVPKSEAPYVEFADAVEKARATAVVTFVAVVANAARKGIWQAAAWWLERTRPEEFGRKWRGELTGPGGGPISLSQLMAEAASDPERTDEVANQRPD
jgi:hypothetical protein